MATINFYQRRNVQDSLPGVAMASGADPIGNALERIGGIGMGIADQMRRQQEKEANDLDAVQVANILSEGDAYWQQNLDERSQAWKVGDPDMRETIRKDLLKWAEENERKLATPASKEYFRKQVASMQSRFVTSAYSFQRKATEAKLTADSAVAEDADERTIASAWQDPKLLDQVTTRRIEALLARSDLDEATKIKEAQRIKQRYTLARERAFVENDPEGWLAANPGEKPPKATPDSLKPSASTVAPVVAGEVPDDLWRAQIGQESGGKQFAADGKPLTSKAGAIGVAQVMPGTGPEAARLAGLPWDETRYKNDPAYNEAIGRAYMNAQLKRFGGDVQKALAAYNAGPGRVESLVEKHGENWLQYAPAETKDYVSKISKRAGMDRREPGVQLAAADTGVVSDAGQGFTVPPLSTTAARLDPDKVYALRNIAETRVRQIGAQFKAETDRLLKDLQAGHQDGKVEPVELAPERFTRAYGEDGQRIYEEYKKSRQMGQDIAAYTTKSFDEIRTDIEASQPQPGEGYASADARRATKIQAASSVMQKREADPVKYATETSPRVNALSKQLANPNLTPQERQSLNVQFLDANMAEQQRLGIQKRRLLTPSQADRWAQMAMAATRPEDSANLIASLESEYGTTYFPQVFQELVRDGKISGELLVIPNLPSQSARENVSRLARVKDEELAKAVTADQQKIVKEQVTEVLTEFARAIPVMSAQSVGTVNSYESIMRKMAYEQIAAGRDPADAVKNAQTMLLGHYDIRDGVRYPKAVNVAVAGNGMNIAVSELKDVDAPPDMAGARTPEEAKQAHLEQIRARPLWHTTDDDKGVQLYVLRDNGTKLMVTAGGKPVRFTWDQLAAMNDPKAAANEVEAFKRSATTGNGDAYLKRMQELQIENLRNNPPTLMTPGNR
jgi:soluble lytic murein transglycosylase-like protein